ncbi:MAG: ROK family transcriptional regulator [Clostridiales bacterium]|nr:ROK family transcriptional regulator [Clostridiales bacterium]
MQKKGVSLPEARRQNRVQIKELIYKKGPITRTEVARRLGLTLPTITTSAQEMLAEGSLLERENDGKDEPNPRGGRKPLYLDVNPSAGYVIGLELGPYRTTLCLTDLRGNTIHKRLFAPVSRDYDEMVATVTRQVSDLLQKEDVPQDKFLGVGVSLPGFIESEKGVIRSSMRTGWNGKALGPDLQKSLGCPVLLENNVRVRAIGVEMFSSVPRPDTFAYYFVSKGIACSLMIQNDIFSGKTAGAGEVGHMVVQPYGPVCETCHNRGCLEALAGENAILRQCASVMENVSAETLKSLSDDEEDAKLEYLLKLQRENNPLVSAVMDNVVFHLGLALANIINFISPRLVLVEGHLMRNEQNRERLLKVTHQNLFGLNETEVDIEFMPFDQFSGANGSAALVVKKKFIHNA